MVLLYKLRGRLYHQVMLSVTTDLPNSLHTLISCPLCTTVHCIFFWVMEEKGRKNAVWVVNCVSFQLTPTRAFTIKSNIAESTL